MPQLRGLPKDSPDVRLSKTLAYLLRHGAEKEGLPMRRDGYVKVHDLLAHHTLRDLTFPHLHHLVATNAKQRFALLFANDPTPAEHQPKSTKGKGKGKQKGKDQGVAEALEGLSVSSPSPNEEQPLIPLDAPEVESYWEPEAASGNLSLPDPFAASGSKPPKVKGPPAPGPNEPQWFIRAAQGHSIASVEAEQLLEPVTTSSSEDLARVGEMVHGTRSSLWDTIREQGLSRQKRQHIHLATAKVGAKSGMRATSDLYIYLDLKALLDSQPPIPVFLSSNGVVLTPGNSEGIVPSSMFKRVVRRVRSKELVEEWEELLWEDGHAVDPPRRVTI